MTGRDQAFSVGRIVVALESGCENLRALEMAAELAARMRAELHGIFIDDIHLLTLAALPFARQTSLHSGATHPIDPGDLEIELRALAGMARRSLEDVAGRLQIPWSFETVRGDLASVVAATHGTDVLVVETSTRPFARHMRMTTEWSEIALKCERACLLMSTGTGRVGGVLAVYDGSEAGEQAVAAALALDGKRGAGLTIASLASKPEESALRQRLQQSEVRAEIETIAGVSSAELSRIIARAKCDLVILPAALVAKHRTELRELLTAPPCALLLVT